MLIKFTQAFRLFCFSLSSLYASHLLAADIDLTDIQRAHRILERAQLIAEGRYNDDQEINLTSSDSWDNALAKKLAESKLILLGLKQKVHVTVVLPVYREVNRMKSKNDHENGEDFLREKLHQLAWFSDCPNFSWDMIIVDDGCPEHSGEEARIILKSFSETSSREWPVSVVFLKDGIENKQTASISTLTSTNESKKGGAIYYGLSTALKRNTNSRHIILYTDADLSAHLGQLGFAVDQIVNQGYDVSIGSRKLDPSLTVGANTRGGKLWCYFWSNLFPGLEVTDTQVGFKAFRASTLRGILNRPMVEHGLCFDMELLVQTRGTIGEFPLIWFHSLAESKVKKTQEKNFFEMLRALGRLHEEYGAKTERSSEFARLALTVSLKELNAIFDACPSDIWSLPYVQLREYQRYSADEMRKWAKEKAKDLKR